MKITGMKHLRKNDYDSITIGPSKINVYGSSTWSSMALSHSIKDELKFLDDTGQMERVVEYFTDYHRLMSIDENFEHAGREYISIMAQYGINLKFSTQPSQLAIRRILDKYQKDRWQSLDEYEGSNYSLKTSGSSYYYVDDDDTLKIGLYCKGKDLIPMEKTFLETFLPLLFGEHEVHIEKKYKENSLGRDYWDFDGYYVVGGDNTIRIELELLNQVSAIIFKHNAGVLKRQKESEKVYQLKMEGF